MLANDMDQKKRTRQLAPVRVTEREELELMRIAAQLDRPMSWVRRLAYRHLIVAHGGVVLSTSKLCADQSPAASPVSLRDSSPEGTV